MPGAVADSSVVMNLAGIDRLDLLRRFHRPLLVPPAVVREVVEEERGQPGSAELQEAIAEGWISIHDPSDKALVTTLEMDLGEGEAEAIALTVELPDMVVLLDDNEARARAKALDLETVGVLGILIRAKLDGVVESLEREPESLRKDMGFWLSEDVVENALTSVGEKQ